MQFQGLCGHVACRTIWLPQPPECETHGYSNGQGSPTFGDNTAHAICHSRRRSTGHLLNLEMQLIMCVSACFRVEL